MPGGYTVETCHRVSPLNRINTPHEGERGGLLVNHNPSDDESQLKKREADLIAR